MKWGAQILNGGPGTSGPPLRPCVKYSRTVLLLIPLSAWESEAGDRGSLPPGF